MQGNGNIKLENENSFFKNLKNYCRENLTQILSIVTVVFVLATFVLFLFNKTMPVAEGWYSYYAYDMNENGAIPYLDFEFLFPPLYLYIISLFTKIFGYAIISLRILGVVIYLTTGIFAYLIFKRVFKNNVIACLTAIVVTAYLQAEVVQVFYDYIRFMDLFVFISVYFTLRYVDKLKTGNIKLFQPSLILAVIFACLASLCKQSSGLFFLIIVEVLFAFYILFFENKKKQAINFALSFAVIFVVYLLVLLPIIINGAFSAYIKYNFVSSVSAKGNGSIFMLLFAWIPRSIMSLLTALPLAALFGLFIYLSARRKLKGEQKEDFSAHEKKVMLCVFIGFVLISILLITVSFISRLRVDSFLSFLKNFAFLTNLFVTVGSFVLIMLMKFKKGFNVDSENKDFLFSLFTLSIIASVIAYAVCTSAGLSESQTTLCLGISLALPISLFEYSGFGRKWCAVIGIVLAVFMFFTSYASLAIKIRQTYSWWGNAAGNAFDQTYTTEIPLLKGIYVNKEYAEMYNDIYKKVTENTTEEDDIFVFSNMSIFYILTGRDKPDQVFTSIQWFDVSSDSTIVADIENIKATVPKMLIVYEISSYVRESHEKMFRGGEKSGLTLMQEFLAEFVVEKGYKEISGKTGTIKDEDDVVIEKQGYQFCEGDNFIKIYLLED